MLEQRLTAQTRGLGGAGPAAGRAKSPHIPSPQNTHVDGILDCTVVPCSIPAATIEQAAELAAQVAEALDYVGVLAVEMFVVDGELLVNELAPRPHNSGHWTLDAARDQPVRAAGARRVRRSASVIRRSTSPAAAMVNLLGDLWVDGEPDWSAALSPTRTPRCTCTARARPGPAARWATSPSLRPLPRRRSGWRAAIRTDLTAR